MDKVSARHARGDGNYDSREPSREILSDRNLHRDALRAEFGSENRSSAISKALADPSLSVQQRNDLSDAFDDHLTPLADDAARGSAYADGATTAQFAAQVEALIARLKASL